jgi:hypothetical protein
MLSSLPCAMELVRERLAEDLQFVNRRESYDPSSDKTGNLEPAIASQVDAISHRFGLDLHADVPRDDVDWRRHHRFRNDQRTRVGDTTIAERLIREETPNCL